MVTGMSVWSSHAMTILKCEKLSRRTAWKRVTNKIWLALLTISMPTLSTSIIIMNTTQALLKSRSETSLGHPNRTVQPLTPGAITPQFGKDSVQTNNSLQPTPCAWKASQRTNWGLGDLGLHSHPPRLRGSYSLISSKIHSQCPCRHLVK